MPAPGASYSYSSVRRRRAILAAVLGRSVATRAATGAVRSIAATDSR
ncbi:hypothetical protein EDE04_0200 [Streptomyces sp. 2132.2]|nr:hypothetical protein EDE04_0200 [Streptomyces sp. 2132.2]